MQTEMKPNSILRNCKVALILVGSIVAYLYFSNPRGVVVNDSLEIKGVVNSARCLLQGKKFWEEQLSAAEGKLKAYAAWGESPEDAQKKINQVLEPLYAKYPEMRPSAAQEEAQALREEAQALRDRADRIENAPVDTAMKNMRVNLISETQRVIAAIKIKLE